MSITTAELDAFTDGSGGRRLCSAESARILEVLNRQRRHVVPHEAPSEGASVPAQVDVRDGASGDDRLHLSDDLMSGGSGSPRTY